MSRNLIVGGNITSAKEINLSTATRDEKTMSDIRLRYTTILNYISSIAKLVAFTLVALIIARKLRPEEYGFWGLIMSISGILSSPIRLWRFWAGRYIRRGYPKAFGTGIFLTSIWVGLAIVIYIQVISGVYSFMLGEMGIHYLLLATPYIVASLFYQFFISVSVAAAPEYYGYSDLVLGIVRLISVYYLVLLLGMRLEGVILASALAFLTAILTMYTGFRKKGISTKGINLELIKTWFKGFPVPLLQTLSGYSINADRSLLPLFIRSELPLAYLTAAYTAKLPIQAGRSATAGLYSKTLKERRGVDIEETIRLIELPSTFLLFTMLLLSKPIMSLLRPEYIKAYIVFSIMSLYVYINALYIIFLTAIQATDTIDVDTKFTLGMLLGSSLFKSSLINSLRNIIALALSIIFLLVMKTDDYILAAAIFPASWLLTTTLGCIWMSRKAHNMVRFRFPLKDYIAFVTAGVIVSIYYMFSGSTEIMVLSFWRDVLGLIFHIAVAATIYLLIILLLSKWARSISVTIIKRTLRFLEHSFF